MDTINKKDCFNLFKNTFSVPDDIIELLYEQFDGSFDQIWDSLIELGYTYNDEEINSESLIDEMYFLLFI